jgi:hypothetical protein
MQRFIKLLIGASVFQALLLLPWNASLQASLARIGVATLVLWAAAWLGAGLLLKIENRYGYVTANTIFGVIVVVACIVLICLHAYLSFETLELCSEVVMITFIASGLGFHLLRTSQAQPADETEST